MTSSDQPSSPRNPVVVHLVHGTWPYGMFGKKSGKEKAWFEEGSPVRSAFTSDACEVRVFEWSGRNSVRARGKAARDFLNHLKRSLNERTDTQHVIVAHSHGGTVAAHALTMAPIPPAATPRIKAVICIATPFAYVRSCSEKTAMRAFRGFAGLIVAASCLVLLSIGLVPQGPIALGLTLVGYFLAGLLAIFLDIMCKSYCSPFESYDGSAVPRRIPTFLIRATRDEAALVLGLSQTFQYFAGRIDEILDADLKIRNFIFQNLLVIPQVVGAYLLIFGTIFLSEQKIPDVYSWMFLVMLVSSGLRIVPIITGRIIAAISVGDWNITSWPRTFIEVDPVPPDSLCQFKSYSDIDDQTSSLRHGTYRSKTVQAEVHRIIEAVAAGVAPQMLNPGQLTGDAEAAEKVASLMFVQRDSLCWVESPPSGPGIAIIDFNSPLPVDGLTFDHQSFRETNGKIFD